MDTLEPDQARVIPLRPVIREPLWRHVVGDVLRRERLAQERTLRDVADAARISMPYLSELERGRKEGSSEVLAAAAHALGLGLADLLVLVQVELARISQARQARARYVPTPVGPRVGLGSAGAARAVAPGVGGEVKVVVSKGEPNSQQAGAGARAAARRTEMCLAA